MTLAARYRRDDLPILPVWLAANAATIRAEPVTWITRDTSSLLKASCSLTGNDAPPHPGATPDERPVARMAHNSPRLNAGFAQGGSDRCHRPSVIERSAAGGGPSASQWDIPAASSADARPVELIADRSRLARRSGSRNRLIVMRGCRPESGGMLVSQNCTFWSPVAIIWSPGKLRLSVGYSLIWRMPRAFVAGSMIQAAQAKPMSAMPSSVFSPGVS